MLHYYAIVFLPLLASVFVGFFGQSLDKRWGCWITSGATLTSALLSGALFASLLFGGDNSAVNVETTLVIGRWFPDTSLDVTWALRFDTLSILMCFVVTSVSSLVHIYSIGYMSNDPGIVRFMSYLSFFTFAMLMLVSADNLLQLFFGWEGVGLASYLLIGFWYHKDSANNAAMKAFLVNRVADVSFAIALGLIFINFGSLDFETIFSIAPFYSEDITKLASFEINTITLIGLLLVVGAMGKSAQIGLHTWLPDAMEGPTPVSALIHAATMVTAGIFLLCRMSPLIELSPFVLDTIVVVGATTAIFTAIIALTQNDIKRVIAYSTCSQLGYMFLAAGLSAYPAAMFHLTTHAFFKALLFLGSGSVIHAMSNEQDMRKMGGLRHYIPTTYAMMWIGTLSLIGMFLFSGYYSKDLILETAFAGSRMVHTYAWWLGEATVLLTAFYSCRLMFLTFHGTPRCDDVTRTHIHESPFVMLFPLIILSIGAVFFGYLLHDYFSFESYYLGTWKGALYIDPSHTAPALVHSVPEAVKLLPLLLVLVGFVFAWLLYRHDLERGAWLARVLRPLYLLSYNKWYVDEIYHFLFTRTAHVLGRAFYIFGDKKTINRLGPDGISSLIRSFARGYSVFQSGKIYHYAMVMIAGLILFVTITLGYYVL